MEIIQLNSSITQSVGNLSSVLKEFIEDSFLTLSSNANSNISKIVTLNSTIYAEEI